MTSLDACLRYLPSPTETRRMTTAELRAQFLVTDLFTPGAITLRAADLDRVVLGGAVPIDTTLTLEAPPMLRADYFSERREIGVLNIGAPGAVQVDGSRYALAARDLLYIGRGSRDVTFASDDPSQPSRFYLVSYPAHAGHPTRRVRHGEAQAAELGTSEHANRRRLARYVHREGASSAQLVMGMTDLHEGSVWNTMPPHTHVRRTEVYLYFDLPRDGAVFHLMGEPDETRVLVVHDGDAVLSPSWSIHAGCGTSRYAFCWAMGGENQDFTDMQSADVNSLR